VKTAFPNGELVQEVYIPRPPGLPLKVKAWRLKLKREFYGLKQSAHAWYVKWAKTMLELGLKPSTADTCLFRGVGVAIGVYVDDALLFGNGDRVRELVASIAESFEIRDVGILSANMQCKFLGMELMRVRTESQVGIVLKQERYALQLLERFGMKNCNPVSSPMVAGTKLDNEGEELPEDNQYEAIVGSLLQLHVSVGED
jgi:hypothetical protein